VKKHIYISIFSLIFLVSLVALNNYSHKAAGSSSEKKNLDIRKFTIEKGSMKDGTDENPWDTEIQSAKTPMPDEPPVQNDRIPTASLFDKYLSNPILIDLPPPANQI
jgi:hypothetical protein